MKKNWEKVFLGEVLLEQKQRVGTPDADELPLLGVSNREGLHQSGKARIVDMSRYLRVERDWFAYNPMRINVGSIGLAETDEQTGVISPDYVVFSCTEEVDPKLIFWFLKDRRGLSAINGATAGSVRERLYFHKLAKIEFPLPPLSEQRRIVSRIEKLAGQIQEARDLRQQATQEANALAHTITTVTGASGDFISIDSIVGKSGLRNGRSVKSDGQDSPTRCLTLSAVRNGRIDLNVTKPVPLAADEAEAFQVRKGDVFIVRGNGSKDLCGRAGMALDEAPGVIFPDLFIKISLPQERILPEFFVTTWNSPAIRAILEVTAKTTSGIWKINQGHILSTPIPIPPLPEQRHIVAELDKLQSEIDALKRLQTETAAELDALLPAILDKAFKGEL